MKKCSFCDITKGKISSLKVYETDHILIFAPLKETIMGKGHIIIIPKKHYENFYDINERELSEIVKTIKRISIKLKDKLNADGLNILHASGKSGQQSVFHFHIHIIPRYKNDGLDTWPKTGYKEKDYSGHYNLLKKILN